MNSRPHETMPEEFAKACAGGHGALAGATVACGTPAPLTDCLRRAYERAFAHVFDAGVRAGARRQRHGR